MPAEKRRERRPRTCIFSTAGTEGNEVANHVFEISDGKVAELNVGDLHHLRKLCHEAFKILDTNVEDCYVDIGEFLRVVPESPFIMDLLGVTEKQAKGPRHELESFLTAIFDAVDVSRDGHLDVDEFVHFLHHRQIAGWKDKK